MRIYTAHVSETAPPVLIREGYAWGAAVFGPFWLIAHRAWAAAVVVICLDAFILLRLPAHLHAPLLLIMDVALGLFGHDLWREALSRRGYVAAHVLAGRDWEAAYGRLLAARPDLVGLAAR